MRFLVSIAFGLLFSIATFGQQAIDFNNYTAQKCNGVIPADLTANARLNYEKNALAIDDSDKGKRRKNDEKEFYLQNNFSIQDFLLSGQILYNDTFTNYINKIADVLLKENPKLRAKLRFYCVKSAEVNAFATQEGIVFVNVGLFSSVKNEAQIAFILAHEISHYTEGHVLQGYLETKKIVRGEGSYRFMDYYSRLRSFFRYSRDSELEADKQGWVLYNRSAYAKNIVTDVFDMLLYSYIPFDSMQFDIHQYEQKDYRFPKNYQLEKTTPLFAEESRDDNFSTHPNVRDRKKKISESIGQDSAGGDLYLVSKSDFEALQKIARYEMARYYIAQSNFADAYYHTMMIEKNYGVGIYSSKMKAMALYGLAKHLNVVGKSAYLITPHEDVQSQPQQFYYFLNALNQKETTILALREINKYKTQFPDEPIFGQLQQDLMKTLILDNKATPEEFYTQWSNKSDSLLSDKERENYYKYAFVNNLADPLFYQELQSFETFRNKNKNYWKKNKYSKKESVELGKKKEVEIDQITMFQPAFQKVISSITSMPKVDYLNGLAEKEFLNTQLQSIANSENVNLSFVEKTPEQFTTESYNNFSAYVNWLAERNNNNQMKMVSLNDYQIDSTQNANYLGILEVESISENYIIKKQHHWDYNFLVFSKESGELVFYQSIKVGDKYSRKKARKAIQKSFKVLKTNYPDEDK